MPHTENIIDNYDFKTVIKDRESVYLYLEKYFGASISESDYILNTDDILNIMENYMLKPDFGQYFTEFLKTKHFAEISKFKEDLSESFTYNDVLIAYCFDKFKENGLIDSPSIFNREKNAASSVILKKSLKKWLACVTPSRENIFFLAFALEMSCDDLANFLMKGICDKELNYKSPAETAAYYCLKNKKPYWYALKLLDKAYNTKCSTKVHDKMIFTNTYKNIFEKISNEDEFVRFLAILISENNNSTYSVCIKKTYDKLLDKISISAFLDKKISVAAETGTNSAIYNKVSYGTVERYIYYYIPSVSDCGHYRMQSYASYSESGNIAGKAHNSMKKHKWFFSTLLRRSDLKKMHCGERKISRDTILTLAFFVVCEENEENSDSNDLNAYEYIAEINEYLNFCRYDQMNFSYPYDLFIYICLLTNDPIATFRKIWAKSWEK